MMLLSYKYHLKPTPTQKAALEEQLHLCRWTYNRLLNHCFEERKAGRGTPTQFSLQNLLPIMKAQTPELNMVFSQVLQNVAKRVRSGFESYWNRRRAGLRAHLPRFRGVDKYNSLTYPQMGFELRSEVLRLSKIGDLKLRLHRPIEGKVKTLTVTRSRAGKWFAVFSSEVEARPILDRLPAVGVDLGLSSLVALSDGTVFMAPRKYREAEEGLGRAQRSLSRKARGSGNREKARVKIARLSERVVNQRRDFSYKTARSIVNKYERIYLEDLKIQNMQRNRCVSKSIADAGWGLLRNALTYMARLSEGVTAFVDPRGTSQVCSGCGVRIEKGLGERMHRCPGCGLVLDRDVNAARNILKRGLEIGRGPPEYTPDGEVTNTRLIGDAQVASVIQEAHDFSHG
ncbi:MAG: transposase [Candidatus Bathyarchaeota archaeon]|nr:transposase [Candidatus Bathyarchaeota archaeon]